MKHDPSFACCAAREYLGRPRMKHAREDTDIEDRTIDSHVKRIRKKFKDAKLHKMVEILDIIFKDEIGHVKIGNYWYQYLCHKRDLDPINTFDLLIKKHIGSNLRGPFNIEARLLSDFSQSELDYLEHPELLIIK